MSALFLEQIPDRPEWVEARSLLLLGGRVVGSPGAAALVSPERDMVCVVGKPSGSTFEQALEGCAPQVEILAVERDAEHTAGALGSAGAAAIIHRPRDAYWGPPRPERDYEVRALDRRDLDGIGGVDPGLRDELASALARTEVTAVIVEGQPASFCYSGSETERWWDVSIDTLEPYRRRGLAAAAFRAVAERMSRRGKTPVWGAYVSNEASWRLARKLGFRPVSRVFVWSCHSGRYRPGDEE